MNKTVKSTGAVLAGIVFTVALSEGTDLLLRVSGIFPPLEVAYPDHLLAIALAHRCIWGVSGAYITALLAPGNAMQLVIISGAIGTVASIAGVITQWDKGGHWYAIALAVTALPCALLGGKLYLSRKPAVA